MSLRPIFLTLFFAGCINLHYSHELPTGESGCLAPERNARFFLLSTT